VTVLADSAHVVKKANIVRYGRILISFDTLYCYGYVTWAV
jgi:hypothetical protein